MKTYQKCIRERRKFSVKVPSSNGEGEYTISGYFENGVVSCTCPGFQFNGTCKHTRFETEECGWSAADSPETQTLHQRNNHICPRCGGGTVDAARGNFEI